MGTKPLNLKQAVCIDDGTSVPGGADTHALAPNLEPDVGDVDLQGLPYSADGRGYPYGLQYPATGEMGASRGCHIVQADVATHMVCSAAPQVVHTFTTPSSTQAES